jgi:hypothetical protein
VLLGRIHSNEEQNGKEKEDLLINQPAKSGSPNRKVERERK